MPGEAYYREVNFGLQSYRELRAEVAAKFETQSANLMSLYKVNRLRRLIDSDVNDLTDCRTEG